MLTDIPKNVIESKDFVIGDIEKFFELFEAGYYAEQHDRIIADHHRWLAEERNEVASRSTVLGSDPVGSLPDDESSA